MRLQQKNHANLVRQKLRMPAKSKSQQKLFALVHLYQQGKIPADKVSNTIKRIAKTISPEDAKKYAQALNLKGVKEWNLHTKSKNFPKDIPVAPYYTYRKEWKGMPDFLGYETTRVKIYKFIFIK